MTLPRPNARLRNARLERIRRDYPYKTQDKWVLLGIKMDTIQARMENLETDNELKLI